MGRPGLAKQDIWMYEHRDRINAPVMVGVGAAFDFLAGTKPRRQSGCAITAWNGYSAWLASLSGYGRDILSVILVYLVSAWGVDPAAVSTGAKITVRTNF